MRRPLFETDTYLSLWSVADKKEKTMRRLKSVFALLAVFAITGSAEAGIVSGAVREAVEFAAKKFGKEVAEEGVEKLTSRVASLAAKHGDEVVTAAFRKVGPRASKLVGEAGEHGDVALRLLARHGDDGAALMMRPGALKMISRYGNDGTEALLRHGAVGEKVIEQFAEGGAKALSKVSPQSGRRLAMLADEGLMKPELMDVICRHGDKACDFLWRQRNSLAIGATMAAFVANPEPFLDGTVQLTKVVADTAIRPVTEGVASHLGGMLLVIGIVVIALLVVLFDWQKRSRSPIWRTAGMLLRVFQKDLFRNDSRK